MSQRRIRVFSSAKGSITAVLAWAAWQGALGAQLWGGVWQIGPWQLHPMSLLFAASGTAMISKTLRIPKF